MKKYIFTEEQIKKVINNTVSEQEEMDPSGISLKDRLLFIVDHLDGSHTDDSSVTSAQMMELLKATIENFVNPDDTISLSDWNDVYYSITKDMYA
jgi:hypothetical protein